MKTQEKNETEENKNSLQTPLKGLSVIAIQNSEENALSKWFFVSILVHLIIGLMFLITIFCIKFFHLNINLFPKQKMPMQDIEFVLDNKTQAQKQPAKAQPVKRIEKPQPVQKIAPKKPQRPKVQKSVKKPSPVKKNLIKPSKQNPFKNKTSKAKSVDIPEFSMPMPKLKSLSSGLGTPSKTKNRAAGVDVSSASLGSIDNTFAKSESASSHSGTSKTTTKKLVTAFDISPYVNELRRNVKANWKVQTPTKRVDLFLRIAKDGRLVILNVKRTSEVGNIDDAALAAVKKCTPLNPLPSKYTKSYLDVVLVFDGTNVSSRR